MLQVDHAQDLLVFLAQRRLFKEAIKTRHAWYGLDTVFGLDMICQGVSPLLHVSPTSGATSGAFCLCCS